MECTEELGLAQGSLPKVPEESPVVVKVSLLTLPPSAYIHSWENIQQKDAHNNSVFVLILLLTEFKSTFRNVKHLPSTLEGG